MHAQRKNEPMLLKQYYIILFIAITSRSCNGPAVRIKLSKPWGKMVKNKNKNKKYIQQKKKQLSQGSNLFHLHGRTSSATPLRHTARIKLGGKLLFKVSFS